MTAASNSYVLDLCAVDATQVGVAGGKGASLGELSRLAGVEVPPGFVVTTHAFRRAGDALAIPGDLAEAIADAVARLGEDVACAVRSSATAEDAPSTSFAGQHDTYLDVVGPAAVLEHVRRCWASLSAERAVRYRERNGIDHRTVEMAVVVQRMVRPHAAGVLFTADPVTGNRTVVMVEATRGLGEALVAGRVAPDRYAARDGAVVVHEVAGEQPVLTEAQVVELARLGRRIEAHAGRPQDVEWCLHADGIAIVQSRPITTLFPIPVADDDANRVYLSVGHQQMMTDAMTPLGRSVWQLIALPRMHEAGGRLFVDVTERLASPARRAGVLEMIGRSDPLTGDALRTLLDRGFVAPAAEDAVPPAPPPAPPAEADPAIVGELIARSEAALERLRRDLHGLAGAALLEAILADVQDLKRLLFDPLNHGAIMAGMEAAWWLNDRLEEWLGERDAADVLTRSVRGNVTSEMGLALLDVADALRSHPELLEALDGEPPPALRAYLDTYGMRCVGEIDLARPRWAEHPAALVAVIRGHVERFAPGEARRRFERGRREARAKEREVLGRLRALPDGASKAAEAKRMIDRVRAFAGYREYPKYHIVSRMFVWKQALLREVDRLVRDGALGEREDSFFLTFQELADVVRGAAVDGGLVAERRRAHRSYEALTPPRVLTSEGEAVAGSYRREDLPAGALVGLPVSTGAVEGRARVVLDLADADLQPGDVLVTACTDPSWSPLFVSIAGLVTEVGGLMTHGAVIAREYGLPAVVGVEHATRLIRDGQRIRVHGTDGYVEVLDEAGARAQR